MLNGELIGGGVLTGEIGRDVITISKEEQEVIIEPRTEQFDVYPDVGKVIKKATVKAVTSDIDENITARNIRGGVTILGVTGDLEPDKPDQSKSVEPTTSEQVITADSGYELASVTVGAVTSDIDPNIKAENIKENESILGVVGTFKGGEDLDAEIEEQTELIAELESGVNELPDKPLGYLQWCCDNLKALNYLFQGWGTQANDEDIHKFTDLLDTTNVEVLSYTFNQTRLKTAPYWNTKNVKIMQNTFNNSGITEFPTHWDFSSADAMSSFMQLCGSLTEVNVLNAIFKKKVTATSMFARCTNLISVVFNFANIETATSMFDGCSNLEHLTVINLRCKNIDTIIQNCKKLVTVNGIIDMIDTTSANRPFYGCQLIESIIFKNIKINLKIGNTTGWGTKLTDETIINTFQELWDMTGSSAKTLTLSTPSKARTDAIYVKLIDITDEMRAEDEYIDNKKPCVVCESTDEGAMTLKEYGISKNWNIA